MDLKLDREKRKEFLIEMYRACWDSITRSEDSVWKITASYTAVFVGLFYFSQLVGLEACLIAWIIFSSLTVIVSLRGNFWFLRALLLLSNVEQELLNEEDYGVIIPRRFRSHAGRRFWNTEIWFIQTLIYSFISCVVSIFLWIKISRGYTWIIIVEALACIILISAYCQSIVKRYGELQKEAPGRAFSK